MFRANPRLKADLILLLVALLWGGAFVAQRAAAIRSGLFFFNALRFLMGAALLLPLARLNGSTLKMRSLPGIALAGLLLFTATTLQQYGLRFTSAGNAGFVTGLYVVLIPLVLSLGWRKPPRPTIWPASFCAAAGLFLLSTDGKLALNVGDGIEFAGAWVWAFHVIWIGRLAKRVDIAQLAFGQYLATGTLSLVGGLLFESLSMANFASTWLPIVYTGVFSIGLGYTLQAVGQRVAPAADAAILLSLEAAFAALFGWLFLGEGLGTLQLLGAGLMFVGMLVAQMRIKFKTSQS